MDRDTAEQLAANLKAAARQWKTIKNHFNDSIELLKNVCNVDNISIDFSEKEETHLSATFVDRAFNITLSPLMAGDEMCGIISISETIDKQDRCHGTLIVDRKGTMYSPQSGQRIDIAESPAVTAGCYYDLLTQALQNPGVPLSQSQQSGITQYQSAKAMERLSRS